MGICTKCNNNGATSALIIVALLLFLSSVFLWIKWTIYKQYKKDNQTQVKEVKTTIRIFFVSYQILASIPTSAPSSKLPSNFLAMLARINFLDLNTFQLFNMGCMSGGINYHVQLVIVTTLPLVLCGSLWCYGNFFNKKVSGVSRAEQASTYFLNTHTHHTPTQRSAFVESCNLVITFAVMPTVSKIIFGALPCETLDTGERYLMKDYSISCSDSSFTLFSTYSGFMLFVYPIGVPMLYLLLLLKKKAALTRPTAEVSLISLSPRLLCQTNIISQRDSDERLNGMRFLFEHYRPECWYFEVVVTIIRLLLTGVLGLISPGSGIQLFMGALFSVLAVGERAKRASLDEKSSDDS